MFENVGGGEILLILLVILIFFGPKKIPELAASLGKGLRKFNDAKEGLESQVKTAMKEPLDAINTAKSGFESKLREAAEPLHAQLNIPASRVQPVAPAMPLPPETLARGSSIEPPSASIEPPAASIEPPSAIEPSVLPAIEPPVFPALEHPIPERPTQQATEIPTHEA